jgi:O-methyltransferase
MGMAACKLNMVHCWQDTDKKVVALRDFNSKLLSDERITLSIVPVGDGIALCRKRK